MAIDTENTAPTPATLPTDMEKSVNTMTDAYQARLESYLAAMLQAKKMCALGILSHANYTEIDTIIAEKYGISSCSIYRGMDLIYRATDGNIGHNKEVSQCQKS